MCNDYRTTKYEPMFCDIDKKKRNLTLKTEQTGCKKNIYDLISPNKDDSYKKEFSEIYNNKCAYCGVSKEIIPALDYFEIDHFICKKVLKSDENKANTANKIDEAVVLGIDNLVFACKRCNRKKRDFEINGPEADSLHPDKEEIKSIFVRDDMYYIQIDEERKPNTRIVEFYNRLRLGDEVHRIDYLLMNIHGAAKRLAEKGNQCDFEIYTKLKQAEEIIKDKRGF